MKIETGDLKRLIAGNEAIKKTAPATGRATGHIATLPSL
jgi:hypothetical protein